MVPRHQQGARQLTTVEARRTARKDVGRHGVEAGFEVVEKVVHLLEGVSYTSAADHVLGRAAGDSQTRSTRAG